MAAPPPVLYHSPTNSAEACRAVRSEASRLTASRERVAAGVPKRDDNRERGENRCYRQVVRGSAIPVRVMFSGPTRVHGSPTSSTDGGNWCSRAPARMRIYRHRWAVLEVTDIAAAGWRRPLHHHHRFIGQDDIIMCQEGVSVWQMYWRPYCPPRRRQCARSRAVDAPSRHVFRGIRERNVTTTAVHDVVPPFMKCHAA